MLSGTCPNLEDNDLCQPTTFSVCVLLSATMLRRLVLELMKKAELVTRWFLTRSGVVLNLLRNKDQMSFIPLLWINSLFYFSGLFHDTRWGLYNRYGLRGVLTGINWLRGLITRILLFQKTYRIWTTDFKQGYRWYSHSNKGNHFRLSESMFYTYTLFESLNRFNIRSTFEFFRMLVEYIIWVALDLFIDINIIFSGLPYHCDTRRDVQ